MSSAHPLTEVNILSKFNENLSKGSGYMEWIGMFYGQTDEWTDEQIGFFRDFFSIFGKGP